MPDSSGTEKVRPYRVLKVEEKNWFGRNEEFKTELGVCHRYANAVYRGKINRKKIEDTAVEIYAELKRDVERVCKECPHQLIIVRLYHPDQHIGKSIPMLMVVSGDSASADLPSAKEARREWFDDGIVIEKLRGLSK